jgi:hypothetical protein
MTEKYCTTCGDKFLTYDDNVFFCIKCLPNELKIRGKQLNVKCRKCDKAVLDTEKWVIITKKGFSEIHYQRAHLKCAYDLMKEKIQETRVYVDNENIELKKHTEWLNKLNNELTEFTERYKDDLVLNSL